MKKPAETAGPLWVPERQTIIWIDCNPQSGQEMRNVHPFLVLSPRIFNERTSLLIGLPMTTAEYNADNPFAIPVGTAKNRNAAKTSYVLCHQPKSFDWRVHKAGPHPMGRLPDSQFTAVCDCLNQIIEIGKARP